MLQLNKQKKKTTKKKDLIDLVDNMLDENNSFNEQIMILTRRHEEISDGVIEEINFDDNIEIPSDNEAAVDAPK